MLDGVLPTEYSEIVRKWGLNRVGRAPKIRIVEGWEMSWDELMTMFKEEANSGFINIDEPLTKTRTAGHIPSRFGRRAYDVARDISNDRELLPRVTHYLHALREEAEALAKGGMKSVGQEMPHSGE
jgi:hypothetical protein